MDQSWLAMATTIVMAMVVLAIIGRGHMVIDLRLLGVAMVRTIFIKVNQVNFQNTWFALFSISGMSFCLYFEKGRSSFIRRSFEAKGWEGSILIAELKTKENWRINFFFLRISLPKLSPIFHKNTNFIILCHYWYHSFISKIYQKSASFRLKWPT